MIREQKTRKNNIKILIKNYKKDNLMRQNSNTKRIQLKDYN